MQISFDIKSAKIFIAIIFLSAFALQVSAQDKMPKIIWKNLQEKYSGFEDIKPRLSSNSEKPIYLYPTLEILIFDESTKKWDLSKYIVNTCDVGEKAQKPKASKLYPNQHIDISKWIYWNYSLLGENGAFQPYNKPDWGKMSDYKFGRKYKLKILFSEEKYKNVSESESPEFWVKPNEETN